ncbi:hypothetical protein COHA_003579 [Chlorella ohadii]|uniref:SGNH hydrolase-type esterase domain-containing protein n=1 Tax=Chlorella ohadii TaxID=2649997 RepID=A0AAD5DUW0_9CHLO|nr:hypothetical protein COHA_003579 [Chlorella ohadii]
MGAASAPLSPLAARAAFPYTTLACVLLIVGAATYVGVCQRGELAMCPAWTASAARSAAAAAAAARSCPAQLDSQLTRLSYVIKQILGEPQPFLPPDALARGVSTYGSGQRFERLGRKLLDGQPITVAFLGGSITWGRGGYEGGSFTNRFTAWLNATFPHPGHRIINHGLPAVTSALFAACYDKVPEDTDLIILDFAVNDGHVSPTWRDKDGYSFTSGARMGFEQLVRKSLKLQGQPALALLQFFSWNSTRDKIRVEGQEDEPVGPSFFWRTIEDDLGTIAQYYDAPVLSLRNAVYHLLREGRPGFQWNVSVHHVKDLPPEEEQRLKETQFYWDMNHPWDRTGHRAMAELLMAAVSRGVRAAAARELTAPRQQRGSGRGRLVTAALARVPRPLPPLPQLPPPMATDNYEANATSCHMQEEFKGVIGQTKGFAYEARAPQEATFVAQKWGLTAREPGAVATLNVDTALGGLSLEAVQVHLLYLRSWQGMGQARVECASGCSCEETVLDAHWDREATLTDLTTLKVSPHAKCTLHVTLLKPTSSSGHLFSLSGVVVSSVDAKMERGKIGQWEYDKQEALKEAAKKAAAAAAAQGSDGGQQQQGSAAEKGNEAEQSSSGEQQGGGKQAGGSGGRRRGLR